MEPCPGGRGHRGSVAGPHAQPGRESAACWTDAALATGLVSVCRPEPWPVEGAPGDRTWGTPLWEGVARQHGVAGGRVQTNGTSWESRGLSSDATALGRGVSLHLGNVQLPCPHLAGRGHEMRLRAGVNTIACGYVFHASSL